MRTAHTQRDASQRHAPAPPRRCCSSTGGGRRPMVLPPPLDSGGEGKQRVGAQSNGCGSSREDIPRWKPKGGKRELSEKQAERSSGPLDVRREGAVPALRINTPSARNRAVRSSLPVETPTQPRLPPPPCTTRVSAKGGAQAGQEPSTRCLAPGQMGTSASLHARMDGGGSSEQAGKTIDTGKVRRCR